MKVVHRNKELAEEGDWLAVAQAHEREGELKEAAAAYEKLLKKKPLNEAVYNRLMMLYRQLKEYEKELKVIKHGIAAFEDLYKKKSPGAKVARLSAALARSTGLVDKKGKDVYEPGPLGRWRKRKAIVEKRLKK
jgi:tetratricopeptide (TPR) repeat protein